MKKKLSKVVSVLFMAILLWNIAFAETVYAGETLATDNNSGLSTLSLGDIGGFVTFTTFEDLEELAEKSYTEGTSVFYMESEALVIEEDLTIPENLWVRILSPQIVIPEGISLTLTSDSLITVKRLDVEGSCIGHTDSTISVDELLNVTGTLNNEGYVSLESGAVMSVADTGSYSGSGYILVYDEEDVDISSIVQGVDLTEAVYHSNGKYWELRGISASTGFNDVTKGAYYYDAVEWAVTNNITNGYGSDTIFNPDGTCTRGQVVTFLWRANGSPEPASMNNPFTDVKSSDYYYKAVLWAVENEITNGYGSDTIFNPDGACTRGQVATFLWRAEGKPAMSSAANPFTDVKAGEFYYDAVLWAVENGITNGYGSSTTFCPDITCTRGQIVTFLYRAMK